MVHDSCYYFNLNSAQYINLLGGTEFQIPSQVPHTIIPRKTAGKLGTLSQNKKNRMSPTLSNIVVYKIIYWGTILTRRPLMTAERALNTPKAICASPTHWTPIQSDT